MLRLCGAFKDKAAQHEIVHLGVHGTAIGIVGRGYHRLAAHVEGGVHQDPAAGSRLEMFEEVVQQPVLLG